MMNAKTYDYSMSGTTALIYIITNEKIIEINLGDSGSFVFL
jgi:hypothetical protein